MAISIGSVRSRLGEVKAIVALNGATDEFIETCEDKYRSLQTQIMADNSFTDITELKSLTDEVELSPQAQGVYKEFDSWLKSYDV